MTYAELFAHVGALTNEPFRIEVGTWRHTYATGAPPNISTAWRISVVPHGAAIVAVQGPTAEAALVELTKALGPAVDPTGVSEAVGDASVEGSVST